MDRVSLQATGRTFGVRLLVQVKADDITGMAAELAFRSLLALFPFLVFLASVGSMVASAAGVDDPTSEVLDLVSDRLPDDAASVVSNQAGDVVESSNLGLLSIGMLGAIWAASGGVNALLKALNRAYNVEETRPIWRRYALSLATTIGASALIVTSIVVVLGGSLIGEELAESVGLSGEFATALTIARLPLVLAVLLAGVSLIYWLGPNIELGWRSVLPGAAVFAVLWVLGTLAFALYVANFGSYNATYGALGGVVILLIWMYLSSAILLIGAEVNAVIESWNQHERSS